VDQFNQESGLFGPIPVLFATDPDTVRPLLKDNQDKVFRSLNKLAMR